MRVKYIRRSPLTQGYFYRAYSRDWAIILEGNRASTRKIHWGINRIHLLNCSMIKSVPINLVKGLVSAPQELIWVIG